MKQIVEQVMAAMKNGTPASAPAAASSRGSKVTAVGDHEITYAFTNKAKKTVEKTRHFDSLVIATGMVSRPTQELTDACSELGIPCDVIGSARKADMGIEATAEAYAAAMKV